MSHALQLTYPTTLVLQAIADGVRYGFDIADRTGLQTGTVYPALRRLEGARLRPIELGEREDRAARAAAGAALLRDHARRRRRARGRGQALREPRPPAPGRAMPDLAAGASSRLASLARARPRRAPRIPRRVGGGFGDAWRTADRGRRSIDRARSARCPTPCSCSASNGVVDMLLQDVRYALRMLRAAPRLHRSSSS